ncbi:MAG TPA: toxin-antitoxin system YwqK family antitoxin, partial [Piscirickettsiaceae bacterium]|nr:toxin-antitoxin system YwqK family antitoxin [Piscirickettsiaceae bacterium]
MSSLKATIYPNGKFKSQAMCNEDKTDGFRIYWHENGQMKSAGEYKHGKPDGLYTAWFENGNKRAEINFSNGRKHGLCIFWHTNKQKKLEVSYTNGKMDGLWMYWYKNGQVRNATLLKDLIKESKMSWYSNGCIQSKTYYGFSRSIQPIPEFATFFTFYNPYNDPIIDTHQTIESKHWYESGNLEKEWFNYGYYRSNTFWYENSQKSQEELFKHGYYYLWTTWYENGQKSQEDNSGSFTMWHENGQKSLEEGTEKGDPCITWNNQGVKEYESILDFDSIEDAVQTHWKFFDDNGQYVATVIQTEDCDEFIEWEFFDTLNNKLYEFKYDYSESELITDDGLWRIWLDSECEPLVKILKSIEKHKSVFCNIPKRNTKLSSLAQL